MTCVLPVSGVFRLPAHCSELHHGFAGVSRGFRGDLSNHAGNDWPRCRPAPNPGQSSPGPPSIGKLVAQATVLPIPRDAAGVCWWPTDTILWRRPIGPVDLEMILDSFNAIDPAECLLGHLFLKEGFHVTAQNDAAVGRGFKPDFPVRNVGACFKCVGDSLKKSVRCLGFRCLGFHGVLEVWRDACAGGREGSRRQGRQEGWVCYWAPGTESPVDSSED